MVQMSDSIDQLAVALCSAQSKFKPINKDSSNPFFHSKYSSLTSVIESTKDVLSSHGLSISQTCSPCEGATINLTTMLIHESGQWLAGTISMTAKDASPQAIGSCITYARRYSLAAILGVASEEDDDGNKASQQSTQKPPQHTAPQVVSHTFTSGAPEQNLSNEDFVITFGKFKGSNFKSLPFNEVKSYAKYLKDSANKSGKSLFPDMQKFVDMAEKMSLDPFDGGEVPF